MHTARQIGMVLTLTLPDVAAHFHITFGPFSHNIQFKISLIVAAPRASRNRARGCRFTAAGQTTSGNSDQSPSRAPRVATKAKVSGGALKGTSGVNNFSARAARQPHARRA